MKAAVYREYGPPEVVSIEEVGTPVPAPNQVLIDVHATTVSSGDWRMRSTEVPPGFGLIAPLIFGKKPKRQVLGTELSGVVHEVGKSVTRWSKGDEVFAYPGSAMGAHAEFVCIEEDGRIAKKPENLGWSESAALCFGGSTAMSFFEKGGGIKAGQELLVVGGTSTVGSAAIQIAKHLGANVSAVCSTDNLELAHQLGAERVIDYRKEDFAKRPERYDLIMDTTMTAPIAKCKTVLKPGGRALLVNSSFGDMLRSAFTSKVVAGPAKEDPAHLAKLAEYANLGAFTPLIDSVFPLDQIVEAHRRVDSGRKKGSVVIQLK